jgi:hypothetical protein
MKQPVNTVPPVPLPLLEALERSYPDKMPHPLTTLEELRFMQGQVDVVRRLRREFDRQNKTVLKGES